MSCFEHQEQLSTQDKFCLESGIVYQNWLEIQVFAQLLLTWDESQGPTLKMFRFIKTENRGVNQHCQYDFYVVQVTYNQLSCREL